MPQLFAVMPTGVSGAQAAAIGRLHGVRATLAVDGGTVVINGGKAAVLGVSPQVFRSWTPPVTAAGDAMWRTLAGGDLVVSAAAAASLHLAVGTVYQVSGAVTANMPFTATALFGIPGVDAIVGQDRSAQLGLVHDVAVLISAPGADLATLISQVQSILGPQGRVANLVPVTVPGKLPVTASVLTGRPANYLTLYQESAARYCPGLSWTVLAAIGQLESGDGANNGPSSAGALGPMQFMPSTWAVWGIDAFGETGPPNVMDPFDAVPSAARMLCADGATGGGASLSSAIYDYNHAGWYVTEVLELAHEYAAEYS